MIQHVEEGTFQALLDRELAPAEERESREHLASCPACRATFEELREANLTLATALGLLDPAPVPATLRSDNVTRTVRTAAPPGRRYTGFSKAAALLLTVAAAASATIPGSPVRDWLRSRGTGPVIAGTDTAVTTTTAPAATEMAAQAPVESGVSVEPSEGALRIVFSRAAPDVEIRARLVDGSLGSVVASGVAAEASFSTAAGTIEVIGVSGGELRVEIPRSVASATIVIDGRTYLTKDGDALRASAALRDSASTEVIFRVQP